LMGFAALYPSYALALTYHARNKAGLAK
jgi:hypothetical protein